MNASLIMVVPMTEADIPSVMTLLMAQETRPHLLDPRLERSLWTRYQCLHPENW